MFYYVDNMAIIRWTIGPVSKCGFEILRESVSRFERIYPSIRRVVCFNNIPISKLNRINADLIDQNAYIESLSFVPQGPAWPLYPPRITNDHEIFIDNDIVLYDKLDIVDEFLGSENMFFFSEGAHRLYGNYDNLIKIDTKINSGFFGIPPNFNFKFEIEKVLKTNSLGIHEHHHDFQGIVAACLYDQALTKKINLSTITLCEPEHELKFGTSGVHFVISNRCNNHNPWENYKALRLM
jgi:hypothetical protein